MINRVIFILIWIVSFGYACETKPKAKDQFYANEGSWGEMRVPLVKPLYLFCHDGKDWSLQGFKKENIYHRNGCSIYAIRNLAKEGELFLFRSIGWGIIIQSVEYPNAWFIADTKNKIINGYIDYEVFRDSLNAKYHITEIDTSSWRAPRSYFDEFKKERTMTWFPDSLEYE